jgi:phage baseplate assembly protein W
VGPDLYGRGFLFPPSVDPTTGRLAEVGDTAVVAQALRMLLFTAPGERLMRPDYGCDLRRFLFAPNTVATRRLIAEEITQSVARFEDRVKLDGVDVTAAVDPAEVDIVLRYTLLRTGAINSLTTSMRLTGQTTP